jgi:adenylate cyclase
LAVLSLLLVLAALPRAPWILYATGALMLVSIWVLTWQQFIAFHLMPIFTLTSSFLWIFFGLVSGLQLAIAKDRTFIRHAFAKYVPETVVNELLAHPERLHLGGKVQTLSILFSDVEGFTKISETMEPDELGHLLNEYLSAMTDIVLAQNGIIDKYEGDAIMAEFGAPLPVPDHADRAVQTGLSMQRRLRDLRRTWKRENRPALKCRVGINTGRVVLGNMGSQQIFDYTVLGDAVNLASRLESANKNYQTRVMISEFTHACLTPGRFRTRLLDVIKVQGKTQAVKVFEVYGTASDRIKPNDLSYYQTYDQSFQTYLARQFTTALDGFRKALALRPGDPASQTMIERIQDLAPHNLPPDWDGAVELTSK